MPQTPVTQQQESGPLAPKEFKTFEGLIKGQKVFILQNLDKALITFLEDPHRTDEGFKLFIQLNEETLMNHVYYPFPPNDNKKKLALLKLISTEDSLEKAKKAYLIQDEADLIALIAARDFICTESDKFSESIITLGHDVILKHIKSLEKWEKHFALALNETQKKHYLQNMRLLSQIKTKESIQAIQEVNMALTKTDNDFLEFITTDSQDIKKASELLKNKGVQAFLQHPGDENTKRKMTLIKHHAFLKGLKEQETLQETLQQKIQIEGKLPAGLKKLTEISGILDSKKDELIRLEESQFPPNEEQDAKKVKLEKEISELEKEAEELEKIDPKYLAEYDKVLTEVMTQEKLEYSTKGVGLKIAESTDASPIDIPEGCVVKSFNAIELPPAGQAKASVYGGNSIIGKTFSSLTLHSSEGHYDLHIQANAQNQVITVQPHTNVVREKAMKDLAFMAFSQWDKTKNRIVIHAATQEEADWIKHFFDVISSEKSEFNVSRDVSFQGQYRPSRKSMNLTTVVKTALKEQLQGMIKQTKNELDAEVVEFLEANYADINFASKIDDLRPNLQRAVSNALKQAFFGYETSS